MNAAPTRPGDTRVKRANIIVNPAAGKDLPVLTVLNDVLGNDIDWDISVTHQSGDARRYTELAVADGSTSSRRTVAMAR